MALGFFSDSTWSGLFLEPSNFFAVYRKPFDEGSGKMVLFEALIWNMIMGNYEDLRLAMARLYPAAPQKHTEEYR